MQTMFSTKVMTGGILVTASVVSIYAIRSVVSDWFNHSAPSEQFGSMDRLIAANPPSDPGKDITGDPHGGDPHGGDPHDKADDPKLPAADKLPAGDPDSYLKKKK
jgi:hypothetical protein